MISFVGASHFRARVVGALLSSRTIKITEIRENEQQPGLLDIEVSFLKLIDELTNGTSININNTGTQLVFKPGLISGGPICFKLADATDLSNTRSIMYFIEGILPIAMFAQRVVNITFEGITDHELDPSIEIFTNVTFNLLSHFGVDPLPTLEMKRRSSSVATVVTDSGESIPSKISGCMIFTCPIIKQIKSIKLIDPGFVKRIRGVAYAIRVSPQFANRMVDSSRAIFNNLLPDVYINTDVHTGSKIRDQSGPGFGISVFASTTNNCFYGAKVVTAAGSSSSSSSEGVMQPEEAGDLAAKYLLEEIASGGCVDSMHQPLAFLLMVLGSEVSKIRTGPLTEYSIEYLRMIYKLFGVKFKIVSDRTSPFVASKKETDEEMYDTEEKEVDDKYDSVLLSCKGIAFQNMSRTVT